MPGVRCPDEVKDPLGSERKVLPALRMYSMNHPLIRKCGHAFIPPPEVEAILQKEAAAEAALAALARAGQQK